MAWSGIVIVWVIVPSRRPLWLTRKKEAPMELEVFHLPAATWVVFGCTMQTMQDIVTRINTEWYPSTGYERDAKPALEVYPPGDVTSPSYYCEIWEPIVDKKNR